ncbi:unnamed protein product [Diplocarpon coronariae]
MQLDLPVPFGSGQMKMWPHGAKVYTRRKPDAIVSDDSPMKLKEVDEKSMGNIASSVVSSNLGDQKFVKSKGKIMIAADKALWSLCNLLVTSGWYQRSTSKVQVPDATVVPAQRAALGHFASHPEGYSRLPGPSFQYNVPDQQQRQPLQSNSRIVPRYSVLGGPAPPMVLEGIPDPVCIATSGEASESG